MKRLTSLLLATFMIGGLDAATTEETKTYLCIADKATGFSFNLAKDSWEEMSFNPKEMRWVLKRRSGAADKWDLIMFGRGRDDYPDATCEDGFNEQNVIGCTGFNHFRFDRETGRFLNAYLIGYTPADRSGKEGDDTPFIAIGRCSAI